MCVCFGGYPPINFFFIIFPLVSTFYFSSGPITIGIDTLWAQIPLEFSTEHFETMHICCGLNMYVWISSFYTDLTHNPLLTKSRHRGTLAYNGLLFNDVLNRI